MQKVEEVSAMVTKGNAISIDPWARAGAQVTTNCGTRYIKVAICRR